MVVIIGFEGSANKIGIGIIDDGKVLNFIFVNNVQCCISGSFPWIRIRIKSKAVSFVQIRIRIQQKPLNTRK